MNTTLLVQMIEEGIILVPKFIDLWNIVKDTFSSTDQAVIDAALAKAIAQDAADTALADVELDAAAQR